MCGLAGVLGRALAVAGCVLATAGCVLAADGGATTADAGGWFCDELVTLSPTAVPPAASTSRAADPIAAASGPWDRRGRGAAGLTTVGGRHADAAEQPLGLGRVEALVRVLAEQAAEHRPERARVGGRRQLVGDYGGDARQHVSPLERRMALDRGVQRGAEPPQVPLGA